MARRNLLRDSSSQAEGDLDYVLRARETEAAAVPMVSLSDALQGSRLTTNTSNRTCTRVLFISQDMALLNPAQQTLDGFVRVADLFDEVHILVLRTGIQPKQPVLRPEKNVWIYTIATKHWWQLPQAGQDILAQQLLFATGFRPDLIVARDPLESALVALRASAAYGRPAQLHVTRSSYADAGWLMNIVCWFLVRYTVPRFTSVRVTSQKILQSIAARVTTSDVALLPRLNPYESILQVRPSLQLREVYPQYVFTMLFVGQLEESSTILNVLDAAQTMLQNSSVGLIIVGDGPLKSDCKRKAKALGIEEQLVFVPGSVDVVQYLKAAHLLLVTDTDAYAGDIILQAAYAGIPMIVSQTEERDDIFVHLESVYFCEADKATTIASGLTTLMNDVSLRAHLADQATAAAQGYFHQDPQLYLRQYRESIEAALFAADEEPGSSVADPN